MKRQEMIRKRMGLVRYYMCPCLRAYFDPGNEDLLSLAEREKRARELARLRRQVLCALLTFTGRIMHLADIDVYLIV